MRVRASLIAFLLVCMAPTASRAYPLEPRTVGSSIIDRESHCRSTDTLLPTQFENPATGDRSTIVVLDVHLLLVGVTTADADTIMSRVVKGYEPLGIQVRWTSEEVDLRIDASPGTNPIIDTSESQAFIDASKAYLGGERPWWADVVYTMVGGELASAVAGQTDCVGGIVYPDHAFSVGEVDMETDYRVGVSAKIAGHEIAHLLGAHHHFANCAQGNPDDIVADITPCTLMFNDVGLISLVFSTLEGAVVRRYALEYANDTPTAPPSSAAPEPSSSAAPEPSSSAAPEPSSSAAPEPQPDPEPEETQAVTRIVTLRINKRGVAGGRVATDPQNDGCSREVQIRLERRSREGQWVLADEAFTDPASAFHFDITRKGSYRAAALETEAPDGSRCIAATSRTRKSR